MDIDALSSFNRRYKGDYPFLQELNEEWSRSRPLEGLRLLHNIPLTRETMLKLESLYRAGASVLVTHLQLPGLQPKQDCVDFLRQIGAELELDHNQISGTFDIALDCCAQIPAMPEVTITRGYAELTQSGTPVYSTLETELPIYSLDLSKLKCLEAMFGTGEACVRALKQFLTPDLEGKSFVLFGFGKVGQGVARYLTDEGAVVTAVDIDPRRLKQAASMGYRTCFSETGDDLLKVVNSAFAVITATGHQDLMQELFDPGLIDDHVHLINMGADDEYGDRFAAQRIVGEKAPLNFLLDAPTTMFFIDPIFAAHNRCSEFILSGASSGFSPLPEELDQPYVDEWSRRYGIAVSDAFE